jgi:predicted aspartyl protease/tetratricopeptide (TPR) repeat protein
VHTEIGAMIRLVLAVLAAAIGLPLHAADPPRCKLVRIAEWPVRLQRGLPVMEGAINGKKVGVLLDTGAYASMITKAAADRLELNTRMTSETMIGVGGTSRVLMTRVDKFEIGGAALDGMRVRVGGERPIPGVDFILGDDFFASVDIEFDYAKGVVRLFQPQDCRNVALAYWDPRALQVPMENSKKVLFPVKMNGREATAMLDSGASSSVVSLPFAAKVGITPESGLASSGCSGGLGADLVRSWVATFDSLEIGDQTIRDARLHVSDFMPELNYTRSAGGNAPRHRFPARASRAGVEQPEEGLLLVPGRAGVSHTPQLDCDDRLRGRNPSEVLANLDQAIAANPGDTKLLLARGTMRRRDDPKAALADLDAVIRAEPANAVALGMRMEVRAALKDAEGALADSEAAIANGLRTAQMYVSRANLRRMQGDDGRAIEEYAQALKLDPRHVGALRSMGQRLFHAGRFEAAEESFSKAIAIRANGFDAIWLSLSRTRRGLDGNAVLDQELAKLKPGEWPGPSCSTCWADSIATRFLAAAASPDEQTRRNQVCEARYYMAERLIAGGNTSEARPLLEKARDECPPSFIEYDGALAELRKL